MFFAFLILWLIFNGKITVELVIIGSFLSLALEAFTCKIMDIKFGSEFKRIFDVFGYIKYFGILVLEMFQCSLKVMWLVMHPKEEIKPQLMYFRTKIKSDSKRVLLCNSITLTPGTITVGLLDNRIHVHGLDKSFIVGIESSDFVKLLEKMEEKENANKLD